MSGERLGDVSVLPQLLRTLPLAAAVFDLEMRYVAHNEGWLTLHGKPVDHSLVGLVHYDVLPIPDEWRAIHQQCLAGDTVQRAHDTFSREDGKVEHLRWVVTPWRNADGSIAGLIIYCEQITAQVTAERRLAEREGMIRDLFEQSPLGLNLCRMDGLWLESNPAFLDIIGYDQAEAEGLTYWQLTPRKYDSQEAVQLEALRTSRRYGPYEKEFIRKDGRLVPVRLNGFLVERDGQDYIWSLIEDRTLHRALEAQLEEERLKAIHTSKLAMMGEMAASFAHEINNPLSIIDAYAYSIKAALGRGDTRGIDEGIGAIRDAVTRTGKIVHGLRKFARQRNELPPDTVEVRTIIEDAMNLCRARIQTHGVELEVSVETAASVRGHGIELAQVIVNLLNNAFDAVMDVSRRWIRLAAHDQGNMVTIVIEDSGSGIPDALRDEIFRSFFTTKPVGVGTGLGLSISRNIIESHGGTLTLDPSASHTRFLIELARTEP